MSDVEEVNSRLSNCGTESINENIYSSGSENEEILQLHSESDLSINNTDSCCVEKDNVQTEELIKKPKCKCVELEERLQESLNIINKLESKYAQVNQQCVDLEVRLESTVKQCDLATKEKETVVIRYAVSEKKNLECVSAKEQVEKSYKEALRENDILQHKVTTMYSEKDRICQILDNKNYDLKTSQQELEHIKADINALETKLKWSQNSLKNEMEVRKECEGKIDSLNMKVKEAADQVENAKREAEDAIKSFHHSQENRAHVLEQQLREQQATLILLRHEASDRDKHIKALQAELERFQAKQKETLQENNSLSVKVQQLERGRLEAEQLVSDLRCTADQQRQDAADLNSKNVQLEQVKLQLLHEQEQLLACKGQVALFKQRNCELEADMEVCRIREAELLLFTQQLTDKNVRLQSEFTALETKVQQLTCEQSLLKRSAKEKETKIEILSNQFTQERAKYLEENDVLNKDLGEKSKVCQRLVQEVADQKGENAVIKRKLELSLREVNKEFQQCRKKLEKYENTSSNSSSSSSLNAVERASNSSSPTVSAADQVKVIQPETVLDRQTLIEHIVKLQRISARKSEKLDFLEEHVNTLVSELKRKSRLLQSYVVREQTGTLTSNTSDSNKANLAKLNGVMASVYGSRVADSNLTLELSLDINRKLQAVLEDALLKNITLKENVDTLGAEIERLNSLTKS